MQLKSIEGFKFKVGMRDWKNAPLCPFHDLIIEGTMFVVTIYSLSSSHTSWRYSHCWSCLWWQPNLLICHHTLVKDVVINHAIYNTFVITHLLKLSLLITFQWQSMHCHCRAVEDVLTIYQFSWHNCWIQSSKTSCYCHSFCLQQDDFTFEMLQMWSLETLSWKEGVRENVTSQALWELIMKSETTITFITYSCYDYPPDFINVTIRTPKHEKRNTSYVQK
jgi:hypothetical protein